MENKENCALDILYEIQEQVIDLSFQWKSYNQLFNSDSTSLVYGISPIFFWHLKEILQKNIIITITRLFDPKDNKGRNNTILGHNIGYQFLFAQMKEELLSGGYSSEGIEDLEHRICTFRQDYCALFTYRHKLIAHNDSASFKDESTRYDFKQIFSTTDFAAVIYRITNLTNDLVEFIYQTSNLSEDVLLAFHIYKINFEGINTDAGKMISSLDKEDN